MVGLKLIAGGHFLGGTVGCGYLIITGVILAVSVSIENIFTGIYIMKVYGIDRSDDAIEVEGVGGRRRVFIAVATG